MGLAVASRKGVMLDDESEKKEKRSEWKGKNSFLPW